MLLLKSKIEDRKVFEYFPIVLVHEKSKTKKEILPTFV